MRLLAFNEKNQPRIGALSDAGVVNLSRIDAAAPTDLGAVVKAGKGVKAFAIIASLISPQHAKSQKMREIGRQLLHRNRPGAAAMAGYSAK
jgi:hypothetical protein